jgi:hypothetical protein
MARDSAEGKLRPAWGLAIVGLLALSLLLVPAAAEARRGATVSDTATYGYKVVGFDYNATAELTASRAPECVAGRTASWFGHVDTGQSDLAPLVIKSGGGGLRIGKRGTDGSIEARTEVESTLGPAEHTVVTSCETEAAGYAEYRTTTCSDAVTSQVDVTATIEGGVGTRVSVRWDFQQVGVYGDWVPNAFSCVEPLTFTPGPCRFKAPLSTFTQKKFTLAFRCFGQNYTLPPGDYYQYGENSDVTGSFVVKRTIQR